MQVALQAAHLAVAGQIANPADVLNKMREQFLLFGIHAPSARSPDNGSTRKRSRIVRLV
jgi:hypothetical protein